MNVMCTVQEMYDYMLKLDKKIKKETGRSPLKIMAKQYAKRLKEMNKRDKEFLEQAEQHITGKSVYAEFAELVRADEREACASEMNTYQERLDNIVSLYEQAIELARQEERDRLMQLFTDPENQPTQYGTVTLEYMEREIAKEREACAKVCEGHVCTSDCSAYGLGSNCEFVISAEIRARGVK